MTDEQLRTMVTSWGPQRGPSGVDPSLTRMHAKALAGRAVAEATRLGLSPARLQQLLAGDVTPGSVVPAESLLVCVFVECGAALADAEPPEAPAVTTSENEGARLTRSASTLATICTVSCLIASGFWWGVETNPNLPYAGARDFIGAWAIISGGVGLGTWMHALRLWVIVRNLRIIARERRA